MGIYIPTEEGTEAAWEREKAWLWLCPPRAIQLAAQLCRARPQAFLEISKTKHKISMDLWSLLKPMPVGAVPEHPEGK